MGTSTVLAAVRSRRASDAATLFELERAARTRDADARWPIIATTLARHLRCEGVAIYLVDRGAVVLRASTLPRASAPRPTDGGPLSAALLTGRPAIFLPTAEERHEPAAATICIPVRASDADRDAVLGVLVASDTRRDALDERAAWFLEEVARRIGRWIHTTDRVPEADDLERQEPVGLEPEPTARAVAWIEPPPRRPRTGVA
ncbi:MAG: GAF domain-containing protein [Chloroflexota bacterium]|nr:GAF domain-containing protein [Chloroflexota bacterium]